MPKDGPAAASTTANGADEAARPGLPRWLEVPVALLGLILLGPPLVAAAIAIKLTSKGPALFRQQRVGLGGVPFTLLKLRTMIASPDPVESEQSEHPINGDAVNGDPIKEDHITVQGDPRVTPIGRLLRATKLDEAPELWNVVRGEMALVGPRPDVPRYVDLEDPLWRAVLSARPGLTDPATIELRNEEALLTVLGSNHDELARSELYCDYLLPFKLRRSAEYLRERTAFTDVVVFLRTFLVIARPERNERELADRIALETRGSRAEKEAQPSSK